MQIFRKFVAATALAGLLFASAAPGIVQAKDARTPESSASRKMHPEILKQFGVYEDQALQDYVSSVGQRVAKQSDMPDAEFTFVILDEESINAFTTGCCYVYLHRGLLTHLNSEAELASVLGHEIGHVTAKHPQKRQTRGALASIAAIGAAILTGSGAVANLANIGASVFVQGYSRESELEADRLGLKSATRAGYRPGAMEEVFRVLKSEERFELDRARSEGREPRIYHGALSSHPTPDARALQASNGNLKAAVEPPGGWIDNRVEYMQRIDGLVYGSSRAQGIVRDNRFYHADLGITLAFPRGWTVDNERNRLLAYTPNKDTILQLTSEAVPPTQSPREFLLTQLKGQGATVTGGEQLNSHGMDGYTVLTAGGSPLDGGAGPVRWTVLYRGKTAFIFAGASRSSIGRTPEADGLFQSVASTLRGLKPTEFPLAEPYRLRIQQANETTRLEEAAANVPVEKYQKEELLLLNGLYPDRKLKPGDLYKVVE